MKLTMVKASFDLGTFFQNLTTLGKVWGGYFVMFLGVVLCLVGVYQIVRGFIQHGRGQTNWLMVFVMILVGGFFFNSGADMSGVFWFADAGTSTLEQLADPGTTTTP